MAKNLQQKIYKGSILAAILLAFLVVSLGAYTRLVHGGLGCPDWPGCYGQLTVPETTETIKKAAELYPDQPLDSKKAWVEMIHRYAAGTLGLLILAIFILAALRDREPNQNRILPYVLPLLVIFQAVLGMWTVTWLLLPLVVMGHLLGGLSILACLWWLGLNAWAPRQLELPKKFKPWVVMGLAIVIIQLVLGGWTSTNYAALVCLDFPLCHGHLIPEMDLKGGFDFSAPIGANYQGGVLDIPARVAIQMVHRYWAGVVALYVGLLAIMVFAFAKTRVTRGVGMLTLAVLAGQISLGMLNILRVLPVGIAVAHNNGAALLLLCLITLAFAAFHQTEG